MKVNDYKCRYVGNNTGVRMELIVELCTNDIEEGKAFRRLIDTAFTTGKEIDGEERTITPDKIFRCGDVTTVIWKDGTKTIVKLMPGADDSDYGAFTAALAKKIYGNNSKVMRYAGMVQRVKSKAEKKAEKKAKKKSDTTEPKRMWYRVKKNGIITDTSMNCYWLSTSNDFVWINATSEEAARKKAIEEFVKTNKIYFVNYKFSAFVSSDFSATCYADFDKKWGIWESDAYWHTYVFANSEEEAVQLAKEIPRE